MDTKIDASTKTKPTMFDPAKYAKRNCRTCGGTGLVRVHMKNPATGKVNPKDKNLETRPCGCALRKYQKAHPAPLLKQKPAPVPPQS